MGRGGDRVTFGAAALGDGGRHYDAVVVASGTRRASRRGGRCSPLLQVLIERVADALPVQPRPSGRPLLIHLSPLTTTNPPSTLLPRQRPLTREAPSEVRVRAGMGREPRRGEEHGREVAPISRAWRGGSAKVEDATRTNSDTIKQAMSVVQIFWAGRCPNVLAFFL